MISKDLAGFMTLSMIIFPLVATAIFAFMSGYIYKSIKSRFTWYANFEIFAEFLALCCFVLAFLSSVYFFSLRFDYLSGTFYKVAVVATASVFPLFFLCLVYDILNVIIAKFSRSKQRNLKRLIDFSLFVASIFYLGSGFYGAVKIPEIKNVEIEIKNLERDMNLAMVSDIHLGKLLDREFLQILVDEVNLLDYEALLIVGDMFDLKAENLGDILEPLKDIKKPIFFVSGNHEFYSGASGLMEALRGVGVRVLENESVEFGAVDLVGVHDMAGEKFGFAPDLEKALKNTGDKPKILLAHQPRFVAQNVKDEVDLALCGHTHAGQVFPFSLIVILQQKYLHGLYKDDKKQVYVSSGAGFWGPPMRFLAPSEIVLLNLRRASE